jgi:hypothetical protein
MIGVVHQIYFTAVVVVGVAVAITAMAAPNFTGAVVPTHRRCVGKQAGGTSF